MNYDCFQRVFAELPADSFDRLNKTMKNMKEALDARDAAQTNSRKARSDLERAQEKQMRLNRQANRERHMADILKHVLMENRNLDEEFYEY
jgi:predicted nucleotidyltransferase